jgi:predicted metal-dependent peptidase
MLTGKKKVIQRDKIDIISSYQGFSSVFLWVPIVITNEIPIAATNGKIIFVGEEYFKFESTERRAILIHEALHIALQHCTRKLKKEREQELWNIAADVIINEIILKGIRYTLPKCSMNLATLNENLFNTIYSLKGYNVEKLYQYLKEENYPVKKEGEGEEQKDVLKGDIILENESHKYFKEEDIPNNLRDVINQDNSELFGKLMSDEKTKNIFKDFDIDKESVKIDWKQLLKRKIKGEVSSSKIICNYERPSKRMGDLYGKTFLPGTRKEEVISKIGVVIDTSGSIDSKILSQFITQIDKIQKSVRPFIKLVYSDAEVLSIYNIPAKESFKKNISTKYPPKGGGGTDFRPAVKELNKDCKLIVYFTDGFGIYPEESRSKILWVMTEDIKYYNSNDEYKKTGEIICLK